jgi:hypothetical protein
MLNSTKNDTLLPHQIALYFYWFTSPLLVTTPLFPVKVNYFCADNMHFYPA